MAIVLFLGKPLLYALAFVVGLRLFAASGPHHAARPWLIVLLATLGRLILGVPGGLAAMTVADGSFAVLAALLVGLGFGLWLLVARVTFRRAPLGGLVAFAAACELVSGTIDLLAWNAVQSIRIC
jgi:hypothetical protein